MRRDALRTLLVVSERPHPWAFLRDHLRPDLVSVAWTRPAEAGAAVAGLAPVPWMLVGTGVEPVAGLEPLGDHLVGCRWVGRPPEALPLRPAPLPHWRAVAADVERALGVRLAGLRLAPGCGLVLPDGSFLERTAELEALLSAHPDGLPVRRRTRRLRSIAHSMAGVLERHGLPLRVT